MDVHVGAAEPQPVGRDLGRAVRVHHIVEVLVEPGAILEVAEIVD